MNEALEKIIRLEANGHFAEAYQAISALRADPATPLCQVVALAYYQDSLARKVPVRDRLKWLKRDTKDERLARWAEESATDDDGRYRGVL